MDAENKCPKCGAEMENKDGVMVCPSCGPIATEEVAHDAPAEEAAM